MPPLVTFVAPLLGGALIGAAAVILFATTGRLAGISGVLGRALVTPSASDRPWRVAFLAGLVGCALAWRIVDPVAFAPGTRTSLPVLAFAGLCVGFGTRLGNGCTSGHGVCGLARSSPRSLVAVLTFMAVAMATVFVVRALTGAA